MQQISESHKQLLATMMEYEILNFLDPAIDRARNSYSLKEEDRLVSVKKYMQERIALCKR